MKVTVLHTTNTRNASFNSLEETVTDLLEGKFYVAGEVDVLEADADNALEEAWWKSQNDFHPNPVHPETGDYLPARWNGEFAQRSSMVGDVFLLENRIYVIANTGFKELPSYEHKEGAALSFPTTENFWADKDDGWPVFNNDFDALCG